MTRKDYRLIAAETGLFWFADEETEQAKGEEVGD